jgi:hypothetical protein
MRLTMNKTDRSTSITDSPSIQERVDGHCQRHAERPQTLAWAKTMGLVAVLVSLTTGQKAQGQEAPTPETERTAAPTEIPTPTPTPAEAPPTSPDSADENSGESTASPDSAAENSGESTGPPAEPPTTSGQEAAPELLLLVTADLDGQLVDAPCRDRARLAVLTQIGATVAAEQEQQATAGGCHR